MRRTDRSPEQVLADRTAKLDQLQQTLTSAVESLITGDDWRRALEFAARFRARSFNNCLLIWLQHAAAFEQGRVPDPVPSYVAGFGQWKQLGRHVMKGQSGYQILAPVTRRIASAEPDNPHSWRPVERGQQPDPGEVVRSRLVGVKPAYVWPVSMTEGEPIPELPQPKLLSGQAPQGLWDGLARIVTERGFRLHDAPDAAYLDGANGVTHWIKRTVHVRADMDPAARVKTLAHEAGHLVCGHDRNNVDAVLHRGIAEVEAESVALMIAASHNMDTSCYTIPYVASWASRVPGQDPLTTIGNTAARVRAAAVSILERLDTLQITDGTPPGLNGSESSPPLTREVDQPARAASRPGLATDPAAAAARELPEPAQRQGLARAVPACLPSSLSGVLGLGLDELSEPGLGHDLERGRWL